MDGTFGTRQVGVLNPLSGARLVYPSGFSSRKFLGRWPPKNFLTKLLTSQLDVP